MRIGIIAFSLTGYAAGERLQAQLLKEGMEVTLSGKSKYLPKPMEESLKEWTRRQFEESDGIVFIGACGIAVRSIAPFVSSKKTDPAVLVMDEMEHYVISLLSGHLGGANALAEKVAVCTGAIPVVTTATDLHSRFAVDQFAKEQGCAIYHMKAAKEISAAILAGETVGFYSEFPVEGSLPSGVVLCDREGIPLEEEHGRKPLEVGAAVTIYENVRPFASTAVLVPPCVTVGVGCRKGKDGQDIQASLRELLWEKQMFPEALVRAASIDLKAREPGILALCEKYGIPFVTYSSEELAKVQGDFTPSQFVSSVTGVDNVCERSAVLGSAGGPLIQRKKAACGVTLALAVGDWRVCFE